MLTIQKLNHMVSFINHYNAISIDRDSPQNLKLENIPDTLITLFYISPKSPQLQRIFFFYYKHKKTSTAELDPWHLKVEVAD